MRQPFPNGFLSGFPRHAFSLAPLLWGLLGCGLISLGSTVHAAELFTYTSPWYQLTLQRDPARIVAINWDVDGEGNHTPVVIEEIATTQWISSLFVGIGWFTNNPAGAASQLVEVSPGEALLQDIAIVPGLTADWRFICSEQSFEHEITWKVSSRIDDIYDLGHQMVSLWLTTAGDDTQDVRLGDTPGFGVYTQIYNDDIAYRMTPVPGSTQMTANRYIFANGIVWQNMFVGGPNFLDPGTYDGGRWVCTAMPVREAGLQDWPYSIGQFENSGEYMKDFFFLKDGETWHLFYNVGAAGYEQNWQDPGNEDAFGHATSTDLNDWTIHERVIQKIPGSWEGATVSAPSILRTTDTWSMIYTGFDDFYAERVGLATSPDLFDWTRHPGNPLYEGPDWTNWQAGQWADCRDAHIIRVDDHYLMYTMVYHQNGQGAIAIARSDDLVNWIDLGPAVLVTGAPESPTVFERNGRYYMLLSSTGAGVYTSTDPELNGWDPLDMELPPGYFGWEVQYDEGRWVIAAFKWIILGNYIRFWDLAFDGEMPFIVDRKSETTPVRHAELWK